MEDHDFVTIAMEMEPAAAAEVNRFLESGAGDLKTLVQGSYLFFAALEIAEMLLWIRQRNESSAHPVRFVGIDLSAEQKERVSETCGDRKGCHVGLRDALMAENVAVLGVARSRRQPSATMQPTPHSMRPTMA